MSNGWRWRKIGKRKRSCGAQKEEFKHFGMDLEFLLRRKSEWRKTLKGILFTSGRIVKEGEEAEEQAD